MTSHHDVDGGWAWVVLAVSYMNLLIAPGLAFVGGMFQNIFLEQYHQSVGLTAWVSSVFASLLQLGGPLASVVAHHSSCRVSVMIGGFLLSAGFVISSFTSTLSVLFASFGILSGMGLGLIYTPSIVVVNFFFKKKRTFINGIILSATGTGCLVSPLLCRYLMDQFSWREVLLILSAISAQMIIFGALMFPIHEQSPRACYSIRPLFCCGSHIRKKNGLNVDTAKPMLANQCENRLDCVNVKSCKISQCAINDESMLSHDVKEGNVNSDAPKPLLTNNCENSVDCVDVKRFKTSQCSMNAESMTMLSHDVKEGNVNSDASKPLLTNHCENGFACSIEEFKTPQGSIYSETRTSLSKDIQLRKTNVNPDVSKPMLSNSYEYNIDCINDMNGGKIQPQGSSNEIRKHSQLAIFKNMSFLALCLMLFLWNAGTGVLLIHFPAFCKQQGTSDDEISYVMAANGPALLVARILIGALGNDPNVDKLATFIGLHLFSGCLFFLIPEFSSTFSAQITTMVLMGLFNGGSYSLLATLTIHIVGLEFLTSAFGVEMIFAGFGFLVAPPFAGWIVDLTGSYNKSIFLAGFFIFLSAFTLMSIPIIRGRGSVPVGFRPVEEYEVYNEEVK